MLVFEVNNNFCVTNLFWNSDQGLDIPFGVDKEFSKMISRQMYRKVLRDRHVLTDLYSKVGI